MGLYLKEKKARVEKNGQKKVQTQGTCLTVVITACSYKFQLTFRDTATFPAKLVLYDQTKTFEVLKEIETFVAVLMFYRKKTLFKCSIFQKNQTFGVINKELLVFRLLCYADGYCRIHDSD